MIEAILVQFTAEVLRSLSLSLFRKLKKKIYDVHVLFLNPAKFNEARGTSHSLRDRSAKNHSRAKGCGPKVAGQKVVERVTASSPLHAGQPNQKQAKAWQYGVCGGGCGGMCGGMCGGKGESTSILGLRSIVMRYGAVPRSVLVPLGSAEKDPLAKASTASTVAPAVAHWLRAVAACWPVLLESG